MGICLECFKEYKQDLKLDISERIYCKNCNEKIDKQFIDRFDANKMDIPAGKRIKPKRNGAYEKKEVRKRKEYKFEYTLNY